MKIVKQSAELLWITPNAIQQIEAAGRTAYKSEDKITPSSAAAFVTKINGLGHESVIEHASASIRVICDRGVSHEIVRHRLFSFTQESTRYCDYGSEKFDRKISVIQPPGLDSSTYPMWLWAMGDAEKRYLAMIDAGISPQIARSVLPNALKTEIVITGNFREWKHFLKLRTSPKAHPQMQEVAKQIAVILGNACPEVFDV